MNSALLGNITRFILLLIAQILIFNRIDLFGFINPFPYVLFIILYPVNGNKSGLLAASFLLGLLMDMFWNSGGVHAAAGGPEAVAHLCGRGAGSGVQLPPFAH